MSHAAATPDAPSCRRVLLVDDDSLTRHAMARVLSRHGYDVVSAASVASALEQLGRGCFDAVVAQTCLHDGTGFEIFHVARAQRPETPLVLLGTDPDLPPVLVTPSGSVRYRCKSLGAAALAGALEEASGPVVAHQAA